MNSFMIVEFFSKEDTHIALEAFNVAYPELRWAVKSTRLVEADLSDYPDMLVEDFEQVIRRAPLLQKEHNQILRYEGVRSEIKSLPAKATWKEEASFHGDSFDGAIQSGLGRAQYWVERIFCPLRQGFGRHYTNVSVHTQVLQQNILFWQQREYNGNVGWSGRKGQQYHVGLEVTATLEK